MSKSGDADHRTVRTEIYGEEYFLSECQGYDEYLDSGGTVLPTRMQTAFDLAALAPGMKVLDVGCGRGEIVLHAAREGVLAWGVDYSVDALRLAERVLEEQPDELRQRMHLERSDAQHLPFADSSFDRVFMLDLVEHLYPPQLERALREAHRVLRTGGRLVVHTMPNIWYYRYAYPLYRALQRLRGERLPADPRKRWRFVSHVHVNEQDILSLRRALRRAGFDSRVWLQTTEDYQREPNPVIRAAMRIGSSWYPFKWIICNDIFALGIKS